MIKKHNIIVLLLAAIISTAIYMTAYKKASNTKTFSAEIFKGVSGWGYNILADDSVFIHQEYIPVIGGKTGFPKKEQAKKAADIVLQKLQQNSLPTLTTFDLEQIYSTDKQK